MVGGRAMMQAVVTRFAPSPTGYLHLGHVYAAWQAWQRGHGTGGRFLLRIEDIDITRCQPHYTAAIAQDLDWLEMPWDGRVRVQSEHFPDYAEVLQNLKQRELLYPCFCTRADIRREVAHSVGAPHAPDGMPVYPGVCRDLSPQVRSERLAAGDPPAWRLDMHRAMAQLSHPLRFYEEAGGWVTCHPDRFGDVVLARKDVPTSYHVCVTHDDALQGVTLVTRGVDLRPVTDLHRLLQVLMGWPMPQYAHHALLMDAAGRKLSKRDGVPPIRELRAAGLSPRDVMELALSSLSRAPG